MSPRGDMGEVGVWAGGRWHRLRASGRLSGLGRARFLVLRGGALCAVRADAVARALRAGLLRAGPKLPKPSPPPPPPHRHVVKVEPPPRGADGVGATPTISATSSHADATGGAAVAMSAREPVADATAAPPLATSKAVGATGRVPVATVADAFANSKVTEGIGKMSDASISGAAPSTARRAVPSSSSSSGGEGSGDNVFVLVIDDERLSLVRRALAAHIDRRRFDCDRAYTHAVLYSVQPVVRVRRCPLIARLLRAGATATTLHTAMHGGPRRKVKAKRGEPAAAARAASASRCPAYPVLDAARRPSPARPHPRTRLPRRGQLYTRTCARPGREYSALEDQAIVAWLSTAPERERAVNGNRIWRQMEDDYRRLTGQTRSWHSLRNRYLRYLLPSLGALALPPAHAQRLRAAAANGELKARRRERASSAASYVDSNRWPPRAATRAASARAPPSLRPRPPHTARSPSPPPTPAPTTPRSKRRSPSPAATPRGKRRSQRLASTPAAPASPAPASPASYSALTRRYATRTTLSPATSRHSPPEEPMRRRRRRLYTVAAAL